MDSLIGIFLISFLFFLWGSWLLPVTDPVESNYALTAKEMVMSGNWMSPQIYGQYWYDKPIMVYWMLSLSYSLLGFSDLASRLPAAFAGALSVTLLIWYVKRITGKSGPALWSGIMLATSVEFWAISHAIITDGLLLLFTIPTLLSAYIGLMEGNKKHMVIAYGAAGLACLTKGPVGLVLPGLLLLLWCASMRSFSLVKKLFPWQGLLAFFVVVLPWYGGMVALHGSDFVEGFLGIHNILRATSSEHPEDNHLYYYVVLLPAALLPWAFLSFYEMVKGWKEKTPFYKFLMVWCWGTVAFYTLMATKYITYTFIAVAPALMLAASAAPAIRRGAFWPSLWAALGTGLLLVTLSAASFRLPDGDWWPLYLVTLAALLYLVGGWKKNVGRRLTLMAGAVALAFTCAAMEGFPSYLASRSMKDTAHAFHDTPGMHYFFRSYPAGYTYYTGETATRLVPSLHGADQENRNPLWNEKYVMPSVSDKAFMAQYGNGQKPVFLYVSDSDEKYFAEWKFRHRFQEIEPGLNGKIYVMTLPE